MSIIYEPKGKAREYSPLACNIYLGCNHGCDYCYAPSIKRQTKKQYLNVNPRRNIIREFERDCKKYVNTKKQVLFCFMTDPYNELEKELRLTRECLKLSLKYKIPVSILTKAGKKVLNDIDVIKKFGDHIQVGATLTMNNNTDSRKYEPNAANPQERIDTLCELKKNGVRTWASFEPVIDPGQSIDMVKRTIDFVDYYKIGKINNYKGLDKKIDWFSFLDDVVQFLRSRQKPFYIKRDLRLSAPDIKLFNNEIWMDEHNLKPFQNTGYFFE